MYARDAYTARSGMLSLHQLYGERFILGLGVSNQPMVEGIREAACVARKAVHHALPDIHGGVDAGGDSALDIKQGTVSQHLVIPDMQADRRQAGKVSEQG
jgi:hypothetical protein